jgi:hypothetical protein
MNPKLQSIATEAAKKFAELWAEAEPDMESAIADVASEAQDQEREAKFRVSFSIEYNLDKSKVVHRLSFGVRRKWEDISEVPDPQQMDIGFHEEPIGGN